MHKILIGSLFLALACFGLLPFAAQAAEEEEQIILFIKGPDEAEKPAAFKLSISEFKLGMAKAVSKGLISVDDAQKALGMLEDQTVLKQQFDFIQEQQKRMIGSVGSLVL